METNEIKIKIGQLVGLPYKFKILKRVDGKEIPPFFEGLNSEEIKIKISELRGWSRMLLNKEVIIKKG